MILGGSMETGSYLLAGKQTCAVIDPRRDVDVYIAAARDLGASSWQTIRFVVLPIIAPSLIGVALFGFTLSYDEFARTLLTSGSYNTLPLEIFGMTTNVTTPVIFALGTLTTLFSFLVIGVFLLFVWFASKSRKKQGSDAGKGLV